MRLTTTTVIQDFLPKTQRLIRAGAVLFILMIIASTVLNLALNTWASSLFLMPVMAAGLAPFAWSARNEEERLIAAENEAQVEILVVSGR